MTDTQTEPGAQVRPPSRAAADGRRTRRAAPAAAAVSTAVVFATAADADGGPAATLPWEGETLLRRLLAQLADLGIAVAHVITRADWEDAVTAAAAGAGRAVHVRASPDLAGDLRTAAEIIGAAPAGVLVAYGDMVTHREALAGLLADPRIPTAILTSASGAFRPFAFRVRTMRGHVVSASSPYHATHKPITGFLGALKVSPADRPVLADAAARLGELAAGRPQAWEDELAWKAGSWRGSLARAARQEGDDPEAGPWGAAARVAEARERPTPASVPLYEQDELELDRRLAAAREDAASLLLVGLVRSGTHVGVSYLRKLFWARPLSVEQVQSAEREITGYDEDRVLLDSAVKATDGFFTTFFVSTHSKYYARWAARRGLSPNTVTAISLGIGVVAAVAFATGTRAGWIAGAILAYTAFVADCVDGQLARYTRTFSKLGAWLDSVFDRAKEYTIFAGLAIGASRAGDSVWVLAGAALTLQTARHFLEFSYGATRHRIIAAVTQPPLEQAPDDAAARARQRAAVLAAGEAEEVPVPPPPRTLASRLRRSISVWTAAERLPGVLWLKRMIAFPIGERFAVIAIATALFSPRTTFTVFLVWGGFAACYQLAGRVLRSIA